MQTRSLLAQMAVPTTVSALIAIFALAPVSDLRSPRIWLVEALGTFGVIVFLWVLGVVVAAVLRRTPLGSPDLTDLALALVSVGVGLAWLHRAIPGSIATAMPHALLMVLLTVLLVAAYAALRLVTTRLGVARSEITLLLIGWLAVPILLHAGLQTVRTPGQPVALISVLLVIYLAALVAATVKGGRMARGFVAVALGGGLLLFRLLSANPHELHLAEARPTQPVDGPPVLLIVMDTLRADALDLLAPRGAVSPNLAGLAQEADVYTRAVANASWTLPSHASIFTGRPLLQHRTDVTSAPGFRPSLDPEIPTAAEILGSRGYLTSCVAANNIVGHESGLARGFERYRYPGHAWMLSTLPLKLAEILTPFPPLELIQLLVDLTGINRNAPAGEVVDFALQEIEIATEDPRPLFLFLNFMDFHRPYPAPEGTPLSTRLTFWRQHFYLHIGGLPEEGDLQRHLETLRSYYFAQAPRVDREIGRLFDRLRRLGWYDRMTIIVTSDHGEAFWENRDLDNYFGHSGGYEPVVRVPLILKRPGQREPVLLDRLVQHVDILPMLIAATGAPQPESTEETSPAILTEWYPRLGGHEGLLPWKRLGLYRGSFKYLLEPEREQLVDLSQSPWEAVDVSGDYPELLEELRQELDSLLADASEASDHEEIDPALLEELKTLGYVN